MTPSRWKSIFPPYKARVVEPLGSSTERERELLLQEHGGELSLIPAEKVIIDLFSDGDGALSSAQLAGSARADGALGEKLLHGSVLSLTGMRNIVPAPGSLAAREALRRTFGGGRIVSNAGFGADALAIPVPEASIPERDDPFKGNIDLLALEMELKRGDGAIALVVLSLTNDLFGAHPVSTRNAREAAEICRQYRKPLLLDAARPAENSFLLRRREIGCRALSALEILQEMSAEADACLLSGTIAAFQDPDAAKRFKDLLSERAELPSPRDLETLALGLQESFDEAALEHRAGQIERLAAALKRASVPLVEPIGGHAVFVDASRLKNCAAFAAELFRASGVRTAPLSIPVPKRRETPGRPLSLEFVRFAVPRRVYSTEHLDFAAEAAVDVFRRMAETSLEVVP